MIEMEALLKALRILLIIQAYSAVADALRTNHCRHCSRSRATSLAAETSNILTSELFTLDAVRSTLIRQEETIIFALIERAQYRQNRVIYDTTAHNLSNAYNAPISFLEWMFIETEKLHAKVRRYTSPEEHAFFPNFLPAPILSELNFPLVLPKTQFTKSINVNSEIMRWYLNVIVNRICIEGDDEQHGSSVLCDISAMQALSRRIHLGKFVAESKFLENPENYTRLVKAGDAIGLIDLLTNVDVERRVLRRAYAKASTYGQDITGGQTAREGYKVDPLLIADIYRDMIIPLTKDVEVRYLFNRVGVDPPPPDTYYDVCRGPMDAFSGPNPFENFKVPVKPITTPFSG